LFTIFADCFEYAECILSVMSHVLFHAEIISFFVYTVLASRNGL